MPYGFLLHSRPFRENSAIATLFVQDSGRLDVVVNGARASKKGQQRLPVPFTLYDFDWVGRSALKKLVRNEIVGTPCMLVAPALYCGFYLNELLYRLLPHHDAQPALFTEYLHALSGLVAGGDVEPMLRSFELSLLDALGHGVLLDRDAAEWQPLQADIDYVYWREQGLLPACHDLPAGALVAAGRVFLAIAQRDFSSPQARMVAKRLLRQLLSACLGPQPLRSRELFSG